MPAELARRTLLGTACAACVVAVTAACGGEDAKPAGAAPPTAGGADTPAAGASSSAAAGASPSAAAGGSTPLARLADIAVGSAVPAEAPDGSKLVVSRPTAATAAAFSSKCTHAGCTVAPAGKELRCPCHGSVYAAATGAVLHGPASSPLTPFRVVVKGGQVLPA